MENLIIITTKKELKEILLEILNENGNLPSSQEFKAEEKMIRRKAAKFLDVSYQAMYNWTKSGVLKDHGNGRKKFYLQTELIECMKLNNC
jgi:hypothetical protein